MMPKLTIENYIIRATSIHGNKYDYSKTKYNDTLDKVIITCPIHGDFIMTAHDHISKNPRGCKLCKKEIDKINKINDFILRANKIHNNKYDYSKVTFNNLHDKVIIICPIHGDFEQLAWNHINPTNHRGCNKCFLDNKILTKEEFINQSNKVHNNKYDYSKIKWKTTKHKIKIICPIHGTFYQYANAHLYLKYGCDKCRILNQLLTKEEFITKANKIHDNKYDYSKSIYTGRINKIIITCPIHGDFIQSVNSHLAGNGCFECNESKGERIIKIFLKEHNIEFERQKQFDTCIGKRKKLSFDFYLPKYNVLLEYDGQLHFEPWSNSEKSLLVFKNHLKCDEIKNKWCIDNNIKLIRINYKQDIIKELEQQLLPLIV